MRKRRVVVVHYRDNSFTRKRDCGITKFVNFRRILEELYKNVCHSNQTELKRKIRGVKYGI